MDPRAHARPFRLDVDRLAVPGVIGVRARESLSFGGALHVALGPDAGFPEFQQLDDWKSDLSLVDARALAPELRAEAGIVLPEERLAEIEALDREMAELDVPPVSDPREQGALTLLRRARLHVLDAAQRRVLEARGAPFWVAGYTRHSDTLWAHRIGGPAPFQASVSRFDTARRAAEAAGEPPGWIGRARFFDLCRTRWADRALRALTGGVVSEPGLLFGRRCAARWDCGEVVEDEIARAGLDAAAAMAAGAEAVTLPLHGPARRVRMGAFEMEVWSIHPLDAPSEGPWPTRVIEVPAEDVWVPVAG
ncbi:hypothetical protein [Sorangium sp. So ce1000]|uniref:hypothetical protein n=1 Tax=Sorangium sp. So ce1000 TaxID=3133325 RepID=UPI003F5E9CE9